MQLTIDFQDGPYGKTSLVPSQAIQGTTLLPSSIRWQTAGRWSANGLCWMHKISESPNDGDASSSSLVSILEPPADVPIRYYLSAKACAGILRRSEKRGKKLPEALRMALEETAALQDR